MTLIWVGHQINGNVSAEDPLNPWEQLWNGRRGWHHRPHHRIPCLSLTPGPGLLQGKRLRTQAALAICQRVYGLEGFAVNSMDQNTIQVQRKKWIWWRGLFWDKKAKPKFQTSPFHFSLPSPQETPINSSSQEKSVRNTKEPTDDLHIDPAKKEDIWLIKEAKA